MVVIAGLVPAISFRKALPLTGMALDDRERIWDYYVRAAGKHTAEKMLRDIAKVITLIEDHPFAGRIRHML